MYRKPNNKKIAQALELVKEGVLIINEDGTIDKVDKEGNTYKGESINGDGYYVVNKYLGNNKVLTVLSHRLNYAYHYGVQALDENMVIHHIDFNKLNNHISNLAQVTIQENSHHGDGTNLLKRMKKLNEANRQLHDSF